MARIPESELERMKAEVSVEQLVRAHGIGLVKSGRDWRGRCPFHEDSTPSLVVTPSKNLWHCFGCGLGGGPVDWAMKANGISFRHAVELLREGIPALAARAGERTTVRALESPVSVEVDDAALLDQVVDYYHQTLKSSPEAPAYLEKRGIAAAVEPFRLGYVPIHTGPSTARRRVKHTVLGFSAVGCSGGKRLDQGYRWRDILER
ncbi:CHC2 zinc finger domain-containing protein [Paraburkholderia sp. RL17-337-BIB-A]|uniref:CHC2 zinc finger domain-containing protein n=1 Tax=Paraburkholderia sp. RL17-337-BIB-A TaxID=3031636 RepID=UPI0038B876B6